MINRLKQTPNRYKLRNIALHCITVPVSMWNKRLKTFRNTKNISRNNSETCLETLILVLTFPMLTKH